MGRMRAWEFNLQKFNLQKFNLGERSEPSSKFNFMTKKFNLEVQF